MIRVHSLDVGGLHFVINAPSGFTVVEDDPRYEPFLNRPEVEGAPRLDVELVLDLPSLEDRTPVFDTQESWRAFREGGEFIFDMAPGGAPTRLWTARLHPSRDRLTIHCGPPLFAPHPAGDRVLRNPLRYPLDQILMLLLLPPRGRIVLHGAGAIRNGIGLAFPGYSGAGKSTLSRLLKSAPGVLGLSDDRIVLDTSRGPGETWVHGSPWSGDERVAASAGAPARALVFLHHAPENALRRIDAKAALRQLLPTACVPWFDAQGADLGMGVCDAIIGSLPAYEIHFRPEVEALKVLEALW